MHKRSWNRPVSLLASAALMASLLFSGPGAALARPQAAAPLLSGGPSVTVEPVDRAALPADSPSAGAGFSPWLELRTQRTGLNQTVDADLVIDLGNDFPSFQANFRTQGPVRMIGDQSLALPGGVAGQQIRIPVSFQVHGLGDGQITLSVTGTSTAGQTYVHAYTLDTYGEDQTVLLGHGPMSLRLQKLDQDKAEGRLNEAQHAKAKGQLMSSGGITASVIPPDDGGGGSTTVAVSGNIWWQDNAGQTHPVRNAQVYLYSSQYGDIIIAANTTTDSSGRYSATLPASGSTQDIYLKVRAAAPGGIVVPAHTEDPWFVQSSTEYSVPDGGYRVINVTALNSTEAGQAFSILDAVEFASEYVGQMNGSRPSDPFIEYPKLDTDCNNDPNASCYSPSTNKIYLRSGEWRGWDVIHHEYGHFLQAYYDFRSNVGGTHYIDSNMATVFKNAGRTNWKDEGIRFAFQEGWPTYFGTTLQRYMSLSNFSMGSDATVGDTWYDDPVGGLSYDLASSAGYTAGGEDSELAVQRVLFGMMDSKQVTWDHVSYGSSQMWNWVVGNHVRTLNQLIQLVSSGLSVQSAGALGDVLAHEDVSPDPTQDALLADRVTQPSFLWDANGMGPIHNNQFVIYLYDANYGFVGSSTISDNTGANGTPYQWSGWEIMYNAANTGSPFYWKVTGSESDSPATGPYDSGLHFIYPLTSLSLTPSGSTVNAGGTVSLTLTATYGNGSRIDKTYAGPTSFSSDQPAIAEVSAFGTVTGKTAGTTTIRANYAGMTATATVTVTSPVTLTGLSISPSSTSVSIGSGTYLSARASYSDGSTQTVTSSASWSSNATSIATVSAAGYVTGVSPGTATITATFNGRTATASVSVTCATSGQDFGCPITLSTSTSSSVSQGQSIYYAISVTAGAAYTITLTPSSGDPDLYVYDSSRSSVGSSAAGAGSTDTVTFTAGSSGTYYVRVYGYAAASYTLSKSGGGCTTGSSMDCPYTLSGSTSSSVSSGQWKYYKFSVSAGYSYAVSLTPSSGDPDLYVYDYSRTQVGSSAYGAGTTDQVNFTANTSGYYYIGVYGYSAANYTLSVSGGGCSNGTSFSCAYSLSSSTSGSASSGQSIYYKFSVSSGSTYTVSLTPSSGDPDLYLYDSSQSQIGSSTSGSGTTDRVTFTASGSGTYYIRVYGYSAASYSLSVAAGSGGGGCTTGSSMDCAIEFSSSISGSVSQGQYKYYKFYLYYPGSSITVRLSPSSGDPDLVVYDPYGSSLGSSSAGAGVVDSVTFTATTTGYFYVRVYGYTAASYTVSR